LGLPQGPWSFGLNKFRNPAPWIRKHASGFVQLANANYHLNGGYVDAIGVAHKFQGKGLGQSLLQHAINFSIEQGREFIELNVDTGNESGALRLYEKLGFKPNSSWQQYENKNWVEFVRGL
jgi:ribosomal protein S18 acetylase RimI-like enzyme